ncbi:MAG: PdxA family protein [Pseudobdellovibrionaceae bacterium]
MQKTLFITTGDCDGIGLEVFTKSILKIQIPKKLRIIFFTGESTPASEYNRRLRTLTRKFTIFTCTRLSDALNLAPAGPHTLIEVRSAEPPALWVHEVAQLCVRHPHKYAMVTAPLSKPEIQRAGMKEIGHTEILKRVSRAKFALMGFYGKHFNLVLASGHIPIAQIPKRITPKILGEALEAAQELQKSLPSSDRSKPIGILGLNPHAGDSGLIGTEESRWINQWIRRRGRNVRGPLAPDSAFSKDILRQHSVLIALYHDQGLIPFKALHGHGSGVHRTFGVPFIRTSVDHGTAKDIFGKNIADSSSMREAISLAIKLLNSRG